jgi:ribosomal protein S18 acetylase RimI-like enzyme
VGTRVVVRRLLRGETGPTGGPAMTDVLGTCESWADGVVVVRREDGTAVEIATADIVSGKPVPPRPSARLRVSAREAEGHAAAHWPGVVRETLGEWELRTEPEPTGRLRKRANSCLAMGDPGLSLATATDAVVAFYEGRARTPMVQVEVGSEVERWCEDAGWEPVQGGDALFLLASLARVRRRLGHVDTAAELSAHGPRAEAAIPGRAAGKASVHEDWLGLHDVLVEPAHRRRGLARAVIGTLLEWGAEQGALTVWLHVETDNEPAIALYESLGLEVHHACRYLVPGRGDA